MPPWPPEFTVTGAHVRIETLSHDHTADLTEAATDGEHHKLWYTMIPKPEDVGAEISARLAKREAGTMLPFAIIDLASGKAVGMTTYMNIDAANRRVEIGSTW